MSIDFSTDAGKRVKQELETQISVWLTWVNQRGEPQITPVWFIWEDDSIIVWTQPGSTKVACLRENPHVAVAWGADEELHQVAMINGTAEFDPSIPKLVDHAAYMKKYEGMWEPLGMTTESASEEFSERIRIRPTRLRAW